MAGCPVCGLDETAIALPDAVVALRSFPRRWRDVITRYRTHDGDGIVTRRPAPEVWSAVEYAAHLRDGLRLFDAGLAEVLVKEAPHFPEIPEASTVVGNPSAGQDDGLDVDTVLDELASAANALADRAARVPTDDWGRPFTYGAAEHTAAWIVQHATHEGAHHLRDIENGLRQLTGHEHRE